MFFSYPNGKSPFRGYSYAPGQARRKTSGGGLSGFVEQSVTVVSSSYTIPFTVNGGVITGSTVAGLELYRNGILVLPSLYVPDTGQVVLDAGEMIPQVGEVFHLRVALA